MTFKGRKIFIKSQLVEYGTIQSQIPELKDVLKILLVGDTKLELIFKT